jgi:hypothetical protein
MQAVQWFRPGMRTLSMKRSSSMWKRTFFVPSREVWIRSIAGSAMRVSPSIRVRKSRASVVISANEVAPPV